MDRRGHSQRRQIRQIQGGRRAAQHTSFHDSPTLLVDFSADHADIAADKRIPPQIDIAAQCRDRAADIAVDLHIPAESGDIPDDSSARFDGNLSGVDHQTAPDLAARVDGDISVQDGDVTLQKFAASHTQVFVENSLLLHHRPVGRQERSRQQQRQQQPRAQPDCPDFPDWFLFHQILRRNAPAFTSGIVCTTPTEPV